MNDKRNAVDRVRPFLLAMEHSIAAARQRRLNDGDSTARAASVVQPASAAEPTNDDQAVPRLRARPKRPSAPVSGYEEPTYHSQAG